jgi:hypothetical protein
VSHSNTILQQLLTLLPRHRFDSFVSARDGDRYVKKFTTWKQLTALLYAQASGKSSLRDITNGLELQRKRTYHLGLDEPVTRSTLSDANARRSYRIYEDLFYALLERCRDLTPKHRFRFKNPLYSLDATMIDLSLESFPWARYKSRKGALRLHYQLDHSGDIPVFMVMTDGKTQEIIAAKSNLSIIPDSIYCFDRGFNDYAWFQRITDEGAFFVTRPKNNMEARFVGQHEEPRSRGIVFDEIIELTGTKGRWYHPGKLRRIGLFDPETGRYFEFLTNNFTLAAATIARIYKSRWQIEVFFKWIKQNLKIKAFLGTSKNAVLTQVWVAMCYYLLLTYVKYQTRYKQSLHYLHRVIREMLLERVSLLDLLSLNDLRLAKFKSEEPQLCLQL